MSDPTFTGFVTNNIDTLDELASRYREHWVELIDEYWTSLWEQAGNKTPDGFTMHGQTQVMSPNGERWCGWERASGPATVYAVIAVSNKILAQDEHLIRGY